LKTKDPDVLAIHMRGVGKPRLHCLGMLDRDRLVTQYVYIVEDLKISESNWD